MDNLCDILQTFPIIDQIIILCCLKQQKKKKCIRLLHSGEEKFLKLSDEDLEC